MEIRTYQKIDIERPIMLAGWPGMGNVALLAMDYLRRELKTELFAEIDVSQFLSPDAIIIENGMVKLPPPPKHNFYYRRYPDLIIFEGETQLRGKAGVILIEQILKLVKELRVSEIFTGAAFPLPMSYEEPSVVYGCATTHFLKDLLLKEYQVKIMDKGEISGLNGLLLGYAEQAGIPAACLLATMPLYAINLPNPKASRAIVKIIERILGIKIDTTGLDIEIEHMEKEMAGLEKRIKEELSTIPSDKTSGEVPLYVRQKIERLFREVRQDKNKAYMLKKELDKWNLFEAYEDRFLDLFKEH